MKKLTFIALLLALLPAHLLAWSGKGHALVAELAESRLTPATRAELKQLLGGESLASISDWADHIKGQFPQTYSWHFVDIPENAAGFSEPRDCFHPQGNGWKHADRHNCVVDRIEIFAQVLGDHSAPPEARLTALKWVVHLVADVHQPLHALAEAHGGNDIELPVFGSLQCGPHRCNLHSAWDDALIWHADLRNRQYVQILEQLIRTEHLDRQAGGTPADWANESHAEARKILDTRPAAVDEAYYRRNIGTVNRRLALAGLRLAALLNQTLGQTQR
ncbi:MAG TPA: S1/P1 nuclease [Terriglobales bacterium]|nr:S1/P1 nuclease [Terriglobales bacterium]